MKTLVRLCVCTVSPESSLYADAIIPQIARSEKSSLFVKIYIRVYITHVWIVPDTDETIHGHSLNLVFTVRIYTIKTPKSQDAAQVLTKEENEKQNLGAGLFGKEK